MPLPTLQAQATQQVQPVPQNSQNHAPDPAWTVVGTYGGVAALLLTVGKAYADYQLKAAMEDRALKTKENAQGLELEGRVFSSLLSQQENSVSSTGALLNTFIAKTLNQAEVTNEQTTSLIATIGTLTEAIKFLGDTQQAQSGILYELKEYSESHNSELTELRALKTEMLNTLNLNITLTNQVLATIEKLLETLVNTNVNVAP